MHWILWITSLAIVSGIAIMLFNSNRLNKMILTGDDITKQKCVEDPPTVVYVKPSSAFGEGGGGKEGEEERGAGVGGVGGAGGGEGVGVGVGGVGGVGEVEVEGGVGVGEVEGGVGGVGGGTGTAGGGSARETFPEGLGPASVMMKAGKVMARVGRTRREPLEARAAFMRGVLPPAKRSRYMIPIQDAQ